MKVNILSEFRGGLTHHQGTAKYMISSEKIKDSYSSWIIYGDLNLNFSSYFCVVSHFVCLEIPPKE